MSRLKVTSVLHELAPPRTGQSGRSAHQGRPAGHPADVAERRSQSRWYTTKTEPSFEDMTIKLRPVIIASRFRPQAPHQASAEETRAVLLAWAAAET
jgi:hypothetical protein